MLQSEHMHLTFKFIMHLITVNIDSTDLLVVQNSQINYFRRIKKKQKKNREREHDKQVKENLKIEWHKCAQITLIY